MIDLSRIELIITKGKVSIKLGNYVELARKGKCGTK